MTRDELEFLICQHLDGTISAEDLAALDRQLAQSDQARQLLVEHEALQSAMKSLRAPQVAWDNLAARVSGRVGTAHLPPRAGEVGSAHPTLRPASVPDEVEYRLTQYIDNELSQAERAELDAQLASDPGLRQLLAEHRSLDAVVKHAWPMPHADFDRFAEHISAAVDEADEATRQRYSISAWMRQGARLAMAACLLIAIGLGLHFMLQDRGTIANKVQVVEIEGAQHPTGSPLVEITVGPSDHYARSEAADSPVVSGRSEAQLAGGFPRATDSVWLPY